MLGFFLDGSLASRREGPFPRKLTRGDVKKTGLRLLVGLVVVVGLWAGAILLGDRPIGKSPIAWLVYALAMTVCLAVFQLNQELKGKRGIGWQGALFTGVVTTTALYLAAALGR
jgi:hypothetical protein